MHRGPDDGGIWVDPRQGVAFGFRRLSIIDLTECGHQPMSSQSGRFTIIFNGEVYNFGDLRRDLERVGTSFAGHSDTEVILAAFEQWGIEASVRRFVGMFAMAVWDAETHTLSLIRDRMGIKPLFYYHEPGYFSFGSELKALAAGPCFSREIDRDALTAYLRYLFVPAPRSIWRGVRKLMPGHILTVRDPALAPAEPVPFWSIRAAAHTGVAEPFGGSGQEAIDALERLLADAVALRMIADVPVGALLSGGVDSSVVVALMQATSDRPVKTYTIAFDDPAHDEAACARRVAHYLHTEHTELLVTGREALDVIPRLPEMFDEPHGDPSQVPTYLVSALARREVTVALTGDGGDELFAGYNRYTWGARVLGRAERLPTRVRQLLAAGIGSVTPGDWDRLHRAVSRVLPPAFRQRFPGDKARKIASMLQESSAPAMYRSLLSAWQQPEQLVIGAAESPDIVLQVLGGSGLPLLDRMMLCDQIAYLPDDLLTKVDRASMAVSLEARVPLLDHRVVEFSWKLPHGLKVRGTQGKWILRQVLHRHVPAELVDRPKTGFSVPVDAWLRGPLKDWASDLLSRGRLARGGVLDPDVVAREWREYAAGHRPGGLGIWAVLMFQAWHERWAA